MANKRRSQVVGSVNTTFLRASRWQWVAWLRLSIPVLVLALTLGAKPALAQNSEREARSATSPRPELVFDRDCVEVVKPSPDFQLHVPLNKKGDPVDALIYSTGKLDFKVKALGCAKVKVRPETAAKTAKEGGGKKPCCDFGQ